MNTKMFVGNLSFNTTETDLRDLCGDYGTVTDLYFPLDQMSGRPRGFAFVTMDSITAMNEAIKALNGKEVGGRALNVNEARPKEERPRDFGGGGGGGRGGYGGGREDRGGKGGYSKRY